MDRLMELGLSMSMATQMMNVMNNTMSKMQIPGQTLPSNVQAASSVAPPPPGEAEPADLQITYAAIDGHVAGPFTEKQLISLIKISSIDQKTLVWRPGMTEWKYAADVPEVYKLILLSQ